MIRSYRSKPLKKFATDGDASKLPVPAASTGRVRRCLNIIEAASQPDDADVAGYDFHGLQGKPKRYALKVTANYRITFGWDGPDAIDLDLEDYH